MIPEGNPSRHLDNVWKSSNHGGANRGSGDYALRINASGVQRFISSLVARCKYINNMNDTISLFAAEVDEFEQMQHTKHVFHVHMFHL